MFFSPDVLIVYHFRIVHFEESEVECSSAQMSI